VSKEALHKVVAAVIERAGGASVSCRDLRAVGGGCIHRCFEIGNETRRCFVKVSETRNAADMFAAEVDGLVALQQAGAFRVPAVVGMGRLDTGAVLVLEHIALRRLEGEAQARAGRALARQHRVSGEYFGWTRDNYLGRTPQINTPSEDWMDFFLHHRLGFQLRRLQQAEPGFPGIDHLEDFLAGYTPQPSLLHGDLWGGNIAADADGAPVVYDPAVHYGDRECDLAMTHLFGGFSAAFYRAYEEEWPLHPGYRQRRRVYQLYHIINHANLFGGGYVSQAESVLRGLQRPG